MFQRNPGPQSQAGVPTPEQLARMMGTTQSAQAPGVPAEQAVVVGDQYLLFSLLDREFGILAEHVQSVERLGDVTPVPNVAAWVLGVLNLRGAICSVVDLRAFLDMETLPYNPRTRLLSVKCNEMVISLVVDGVNEMLPIATKAIDATMRAVPLWVNSYASGLASIGKRRVILLDAARLLFAEKMHRFSI